MRCNWGSGWRLWHVECRVEVAVHSLQQPLLRRTVSPSLLLAMGLHQLHFRYWNDQAMLFAHLERFHCQQNENTRSLDVNEESRALHCGACWTSGCKPGWRGERSKIEEPKFAEDWNFLISGMNLGTFNTCLRVWPQQSPQTNNPLSPAERSARRRAKLQALHLLQCHLGVSLSCQSALLFSWLRLFLRSYTYPCFQPFVLLTVLSPILVGGELRF